jgi:hypothetical protein
MKKKKKEKSLETYCCVLGTMILCQNQWFIAIPEEQIDINLLKPSTAAPETIIPLMGLY